MYSEVERCSEELVDSAIPLTRWQRFRVFYTLPNNFLIFVSHASKSNMNDVSISVLVPANLSVLTSPLTLRDEAPRQLNLSSAAVAMSIHRMRRRYGELLREEVATTVDDPAEVEDELRTLMAIVRRSEN